MKTKSTGNRPTCSSTGKGFVVHTTFHCTRHQELLYLSSQRKKWSLL